VANETSTMSPSTPTYAPGTPMWVDLATPDVEAATRFYNQIFGWTSQDLGEEAGHYNMFFRDGKSVAAATPPQNPNQPASWSTYIATENAEDTANKVKEAGGQVLMPPFQVMDQGTMAVFMDPTGAIFCVWQPAAMKGAEHVNDPGGFSWNELATRDMDAARAFYTRVFPWTAKVNEMPQGGQYIEWQVNGRSIAGGLTMGSQYPANVPAHWLVYFTVENTDDTVKRAQDLGGRVMVPAVDIPQGRFAVLADPQGAPFAVIQMPQSS
jgi:uncharacterized protein